MSNAAAIPAAPRAAAALRRRRSRGGVTASAALCLGGAWAAFLFLAACVSAQTGTPSKFDSNRAWEHLRRQVSFGPRPSGSVAIADTRRYIVSQLKAAGIEAREQAFEAKTPLGPIRMANVVGTIPGARPERIALATHFDTKLFRGFRFVGASDGGSSTAVVLELGRVLAGRKNPFTIELLFFDGEEAVNEEWRDPDNRYGSRHYVEQAQKAGTLAGMKALVLLDLVGDRNLNFRRESNSTRWLTDIIWATAKRLGHADHFWYQETPIEDDHIPFLRAGVPAVDLIDLDYPAWHTAQDTLDAVSARSLQVVGDVVLASLPEIEKHLASLK
jgi:Zn-dependent M28 family amino/carboxypeptidase